LPVQLNNGNRAVYLNEKILNFRELNRGSCVNHPTATCMRVTNGAMQTLLPPSVKESNDIILIENGPAVFEAIGDKQTNKHLFLFFKHI